MGSKAGSREALIDAAEAVVREKGASHLTLDAVSARAGVSKGGLLYHFRTKEALILAMVDRMAGFIRSVRNSEGAKLPSSPARDLKSYVRAFGSGMTDKLGGTAAAILAAGAENPKLLRSIEETREKGLARLRCPGMSTAFTEIVFLSLEGLWILEVLGLRHPTRGARKAIIKELLRLIDREEALLKG